MAFQVPRKAILTKEQLEFFQTSKTRQEVISYIEVLNDAVVGVRLNDECSLSTGAAAVLVLLDSVERVARDTPPVENSASRFGNPAFRTFYDCVSEVRLSILNWIEVFVNHR